MKRSRGRPGRARRRGLLLGLAAAALSSVQAGAIDVASGDLVGVFQKNGVEAIVNLGPPVPGNPIDLTGVVLPAFGGSLADAKFVALGVSDPGRTVSVGGDVVPRENILFSTEEDFPAPTDLQIENAMNQLDSEIPGSGVWFELLRDVSSSAVDEVQTTELFSYESRLGVGTDAIANTILFSVAGTVDAGQNLTINIWEAVRGYQAAGGPPTELTPVAAFELVGGSASFVEAPEPGALLTLVAGAAVLAPFARRHRRRRA